MQFIFLRGLCISLASYVWVYGVKVLRMWAFSFDCGAAKLIPTVCLFANAGRDETRVKRALNAILFPFVFRVPFSSSEPFVNNTIIIA